MADDKKNPYKIYSEYADMTTSKTIVVEAQTMEEVKELYDYTRERNGKEKTG